MLLRLHKLLDFVAYWWHQLTTSRYVLYLERENKRLLAENAALHATVHGLHGVPGRVHIPQVPAHQPDAPMVARQGPEAATPANDGPKVVRSATRQTERRQQQAAAWKKHQEATRDKLVRLQNALNDEIKAERERQHGSGRVVTAQGAEVQVHEPSQVVDFDESEVKAEEA